MLKRQSNYLHEKGQKTHLKDGKIPLTELNYWKNDATIVLLKLIEMWFKQILYNTRWQSRNTNFKRDHLVQRNYEMIQMTMD